jgi:hypothetical protein
MVPYSFPVNHLRFSSLLEIISGRPIVIFFTQSALNLLKINFSLIKGILAITDGIMNNNTGKVTIPNNQMAFSNAIDRIKLKILKIMDQNSNAIGEF